MSTVSPLTSTMMYRSFTSAPCVYKLPARIGKGGEQGSICPKGASRGHGTQVTSIRFVAPPPCSTALLPPS